MGSGLAGRHSALRARCEACCVLCKRLRSATHSIHSIWHDAPVSLDLQLRYPTVLSHRHSNQVHDPLPVHDWPVALAIHGMEDGLDLRAPVAAAGRTQRREELANGALVAIARAEVSAECALNRVAGRARLGRVCERGGTIGIVVHVPRIDHLAIGRGDVVGRVRESPRLLAREQT